MITFDPATLRIVLDSASSTATLIYAAWVDWAATADNAKYLPAFRTLGGDDLGGGLSVPGYYFLSNGWRVRPMEADQTLVITGNLFVDGGGDPVVPTLGTFKVLTKLVVPMLAMGISTTGSTGPGAAEIAAAVLAQLQATAIPVDAVKMNGAVIIGDGSEANAWRGFGVPA